MKKNFLEPEVKFIQIQYTDIVTESPEIPGGGGAGPGEGDAPQRRIWQSGDFG